MAKYKDNDTLNMQGDWRMVISTVIQDKVVPGSGSQVYELHFDNEGPGTHGGTRFRGQYTTRPDWKDFYHGESYYDHRGRVLIQMTGYQKDEQYYELLVGSHQPSEKGDVVIFGSWCGTGVSSDAPNQGRNTMGNFEMTKLSGPAPIKTRPTSIKPPIKKEK
jgi:hypothetical protein